MLQVFVLVLREGIEAALILGIILAALRQLGQGEKMRAVWGGAALAGVLAAVGGAAIYATVRELPETTAHVIEGIMLLLAVAVLTSVTFWMQSHSRTLKREITAQASVAGSGLAFGLLAFTTVGREALETAVFTVAEALRTDAAQVIVGVVLGVIGAAILCVLIYRFGYRLNYARFFQVMGVLLLIFAAGLLGSGIHALQEAGVLPMTQVLWDLESTLPTESIPGAILNALLGYTDKATVLQLVAYVVYLVSAGALFLRLTRRPPAPRVAPTVDTTNTTPATGIQG